MTHAEICTLTHAEGVMTQAEVCIRMLRCAYSPLHAHAYWWWRWLPGHHGTHLSLVKGKVSGLVEQEFAANLRIQVCSKEGESAQVSAQVSRLRGRAECVF